MEAAENSQRVHFSGKGLAHVGPANSLGADRRQRVPSFCRREWSLLFARSGPHLDAPHMALPVKERMIAQDGRLGYSQEGAVAMSIVPAALSFVRWWGRCLVRSRAWWRRSSAICSAAMIRRADQLVNKVVGLRTQIYQMNQALGVPDQMPTLNGKTYKHPYDALPMILELGPPTQASMTITIGLAIGPALTATAAATCGNASMLRLIS